MKPGILNVSELFYSLQGEGPTAGTPAVFVRLAGCNLLCNFNGDPCDTIEVWRKGTIFNFCQLKSAIFETLEAYEALKCGAHIIFTGGEPLLYVDNLIDFVKFLRKDIENLYVEVETNGTVCPPEDFANQYNVSPKLSTSSMPLEKRLKLEVLTWFVRTGKAIFKFVITQGKDITEVLEIVNSAKIPPSSVYLMPVGGSRAVLEQSSVLVWELCRTYYFQFSPRLHISVFDKSTGV